MAKFYSESNTPPRMFQPETSRTEPDYEERLDKDGKKYLKKVGETDVYEKIQEARSGTELAQLIENFKIKINENDLTKVEETIIDVTNIPTNMIDALNVVEQAKTTFNTAPKEIRETFNNNFTEFLAGAQNGTLKSLLTKKDVLENQIEMNLKVENDANKTQNENSNQLNQTTEKKTTGVIYE
ncbi:internal scaffolding protein [Peromfec virus RodF8_36]|uniref:Internal scaffolding protein n=1 Tax=Peromfec virus RodF8_36 TaxID=2929371 RepID=A0A976N076_9VIRU|nr:internal scaffolding protein [Peromfec virus RodF8_36]